MEEDGDVANPVHGGLGTVAVAAGDNGSDGGDSDGGDSDGDIHEIELGSVTPPSGWRDRAWSAASTTAGALRPRNVSLTTMSRKQLFVVFGHKASRAEKLSV